MKSMLTDVIKTNKQKAELTCLGLTILIVMLVFMMVGTTAVSFLAAFFTGAAVVTFYTRVLDYVTDAFDKK